MCRPIRSCCPLSAWKVPALKQSLQRNSRRGHRLLQSNRRYKSNKYISENTNNKNIIELTKYKPSIKITRNKKEENAHVKLNEEIDRNKNDKNYFFYNKSCNNIFHQEEKKVEKNNDDSEKKELLKKIKLAKLGKLFKNLEQENNIINTIKEQFLDWTNKNDINLKQEKEKTTNKKLENDFNKDKYGLKTFDMNNNIFTKNEKSDNLGEKYEQLINNFRNILISSIFKQAKEKKK